MSVSIRTEWSDKYGKRLHWLTKPNTSNRLVIDDDDLAELVKLGSHLLPTEGNTNAGTARGIRPHPSV